MEIRYDKSIDAKYIRINEGKIFNTKKVKDWLLFDCDENGNIIGIEVLDTVKNLISISIINKKLVECQIRHHDRTKVNEFQSNNSLDNLLTKTT